MSCEISKLFPYIKIYFLPHIGNICALKNYVRFFSNFVNEMSRLFIKFADILMNA
jgi:hypothetical protein